MTERKKVIKGLEWILEDDKFGFGENWHIDSEPKTEEEKAGYNIQRAIELLKEREAEGKWIYGEDETGVDGWHCSECNFFEPWFYDFDDDIDFIKHYEHCPKCGRRMTSYTGKKKGQ